MPKRQIHRQNILAIHQADIRHQVPKAVHGSIRFTGMPAIITTPLNRLMPKLYADSTRYTIIPHGRKNKFMPTRYLTQLRQQCHRPIRQRNQKIIPHLHIFARHKPDFTIQIHIFPSAGHYRPTPWRNQRGKQYQILGQSRNSFIFQERIKKQCQLALSQMRFRLGLIRRKQTLGRFDRITPITDNYALTNSIIPYRFSNLHYTRCPRWYILGIQPFHKLRHIQRRNGINIRILSEKFIDMRKASPVAIQRIFSQLAYSRFIPCRAQIDHTLPTGRHPCRLFCRPLQRPRVYPIIKLPLCLKSRITRRLKRHDRINTDRQHLFTATVPIFQPPVFPTGRMHKQKQSAAIVKLISLIPRLGRVNFPLRQTVGFRHFPNLHKIYPRKSPLINVALSGFLYIAVYYRQNKNPLNILFISRFVHFYIRLYIANEFRNHFPS